jgi:hypothetical protein
MLVQLRSSNSIIFLLFRYFSPFRIDLGLCRGSVNHVVDVPRNRCSKITYNAPSSSPRFSLLLLPNMNHVETALFSASLISPKVQASLPKGYTLRPLQAGDYERGFLDVLKVLTEVGDHTKAQWLGKTILISTFLMTMRY